MLKRTSLIVACFALLFMVIGARAQRWDKETTFTFAEAVELPGIVLPAGTYIFRLSDVVGERNVVQILNAEGNRVYAAVITVPGGRIKAANTPQLRFEERRADLPMAIHEWFYSGETAGLEFVYR